MLANKKLIQWPFLLSFLISQEEYYRELLIYKDAKPRLNVLKSKILEYNNNLKKNSILDKSDKFNNNEINLMNESHDKDILFFNYNNYSCWVDSFLFIVKYIFFKVYDINEIKKIPIEKNFVEFLIDINSISNKEILNKGIWNYILYNSNYRDDIICNKNLIMRQSSCIALCSI